MISNASSIHEMAAAKAQAQQSKKQKAAQELLIDNVSELTKKYQELSQKF